MNFPQKLRWQWHRAFAAMRLGWLYLREPQFRGNGLFFVGPGHDVAARPGADISIGEEVWFMQDCTLHFYGKVSIGDNAYFNRGCYLVAHEELTIGRNSIFGQRVSIHDQDHNTTPLNVAPSKRGYTSSPVHIGENVWVGAGATILQGVTIGDGAVVAAGSVVTKDVPAGTLVGGVPAKVLKQLSDDEVVATIDQPTVAPQPRKLGATRRLAYAVLHALGIRSGV
jgi:acetyltransferase-like isoleucine patch superfamily enzyme